MRSRLIEVGRSQPVRRGCQGFVPDPWGLKCKRCGQTHSNKELPISAADLNDFDEGRFDWMQRDWGDL